MVQPVYLVHTFVFPPVSTYKFGNVWFALAPPLLLFGLANLSQDSHLSLWDGSFSCHLQVLVHLPFVHNALFFFF